MLSEQQGAFTLMSLLKMPFCSTLVDHLRGEADKDKCYGAMIADDEVKTFIFMWVRRAMSVTVRIHPR